MAYWHHGFDVGWRQRFKVPLAPRTAWHQRLDVGWAPSFTVRLETNLAMCQVRCGASLSTPSWSPERLGRTPNIGRRSPARNESFAPPAPPTATRRDPTTGAHPRPQPAPRAPKVSDDEPRVQCPCIANLPSHPPEIAAKLRWDQSRRAPHAHRPHRHLAFKASWHTNHPGSKWAFCPCHHAPDVAWWIGASRRLRPWATICQASEVDWLTWSSRRLGRLVPVAPACQSLFCSLAPRLPWPHAAWMSLVIRGHWSQLTEVPRELGTASALDHRRLGRLLACCPCFASATGPLLRAALAPLSQGALLPLPIGREVPTQRGGLREPISREADALRAAGVRWSSVGGRPDP